jgi:N-methylhydantoinase A
MDVAAAEAAVRPLAESLGVGSIELALGIVKGRQRHHGAGAAAGHRRARGGRAQCTLLAFGGAGPMHAAGLGRRVYGLREIIVPRLLSAFSALGCLVAGHEPFCSSSTVRMLSHSCRARSLQALHWSPGARSLTEPLARRATGPTITVERTALMRYVGAELRRPDAFRPAAGPDAAGGGVPCRATARSTATRRGEDWVMRALQDAGD